MPRIFLLVSALGLTLATSAQAYPAIPYIPSQWPAASAFDTEAEDSGIVSRSQAGVSAPEPAASPRTTRQGR